MNRNIGFGNGKISISLNQVSSNVNKIYVLTIATSKQSIPVVTGRRILKLKDIYSMLVLL